MAYVLTLDRTYPEASTYRGGADKFTADLKGPPEQLTFGVVDDIIAKITEWFPPKGADKLMRIRIWTDAAPTWTTLYRVEVIAHGSPIVWALVAAALAVIALLVLLAWFVSQIDWSPVAETAKWVVIALAIGAAFVLLRGTKKPVEEASPSTKGDVGGG